MAFKSGNLTFVRPLFGAFTLLRNFVCGFPENNDPVFTPNDARPVNSMLYYFGEKVDHVFTAGTWTITCTTAPTSPGAGDAKFSVTHTTYAGPFAEATENVYYDEAEVCFKISSDSVTDYIVGDKYDVVTTTVSANDTPWILHKMVSLDTSDTSVSQTYCQVEGPGLTDDQHINVIMRTFASGSTYLIGFRMANGYIDQSPDPYDWNAQPGVDINDSWMAVESRNDYVGGPFSLPYHIICNKQRFIFLLTANTTHRGAYCGYFYPYGSYGQYNFPMYIGAEQNTATYPYTSTSSEVRSFVNPAYSACRIALPGNNRDYVYHYNLETSGGGYTANSNQIWPFGSEYSRNFYNDLIEQEDGNYSMFPCVIRDNVSSPKQMLGELDGVCAVPGNNLVPGDIIQNSALEDFVVWRDTFRTNTFSYYAVRLL